MTEQNRIVYCFSKLSLIIIVVIIITGFGDHIYRQKRSCYYGSAFIATKYDVDQCIKEVYAKTTRSKVGFCGSPTKILFCE